MSTPRYSLLAALRRSRRAITLGVWPALLAALLAAAACPAMSATPAAMNHHGAHHEHAAHEQRTHHDTAPPALPAGDCPHCLDGHIAATADTADCNVAAVAPVATQALPDPGFVLLVVSYAPTAASAVPPLIDAPPLTHSAPLSSVPLHIRHCVLLI